MRSCWADGLSGGVQENVQEAAFVVGFVVGEVLLDVFDGLGEDVQAVSKLVQFLAGHDELVLAQAQLAGPLAGFVVRADGTSAGSTAGGGPGRDSARIGARTSGNGRSRRSPYWITSP